MTKKDKTKKKGKGCLFALIPAGCLGIIGAAILAVIALILTVAIIIALIFGISMFINGSSLGGAFGDNVESVDPNEDPIYTIPPMDRPDETYAPDDPTQEFPDTSVFGSAGLDYKIIDDRTCEVSGIGECTDSDIVIPMSAPGGHSVVGITNYAFENCDLITSVEIPDTMEYIGSHAFAGCYNLRSVDMPYHMQSIGSYAFSRCFALEYIEIPDGIQKIDSGTFSFCTGLITVKLPSYSVLSIENDAFRECTSLKDICIESSIESIGNCAFWGCSSLGDVPFPSDSELRIIGDEAFALCTSLNEIRIPQSVSEIGYCAFRDCYNLQGAYLDQCSSTSIAIGMFENCNSLEYLTLPDQIEVIESNAFLNCHSLESFTIPGPVREIYDSAFSGCTSLKVINNLSALTIKEGETVINGNIAENAVYIYSANGVSIDLVTVSDYYLFAVWSDFSTAELVKYTGNEEAPALPELIGKYGAMEYKIYKNAFKDCTSMTTLSIPSVVTHIGGRAFEGCTQLQSVTIPDSVGEVSEYAFWNCPNIREITQPSWIDIMYIDAPMWNRDNSVVTYHLNRTLTKNDANGESIFPQDNPDSWNKVAYVSTGDIRLIYGGLLFTIGKPGRLGYQFDNGPVQFNESFAQPTDDISIQNAAKEYGADNALIMNVDIMFKGSDKGSHSVKLFYEDTNGNVVMLDEFTIEIE